MVIKMNRNNKKKSTHKRKIIYSRSIFFLIILFAFFLIRNTFVKKNIWSISIYTGSNPYNFTPHPLTENLPVLTADKVTDVPAGFVADPFMLQYRNEWFMFFEVLNLSSGQGDIGLAHSRNGLDWKYEQIVIDEPFHLSYPYVFKSHSTFYMIPESREGHAVKLYKAIEFPTKWQFICDLIVGDFADPSIIEKDNIWWLFVLKESNSLALYYSENLTGSYHEHPKSPIIINDSNISRPGGRMIIVNNKVIRYVQDDDPEYGNSLRVFRINTLTTVDYTQEEILRKPILSGSGHGWNSIGMHHIDPHQKNQNDWIACVDGKSKISTFDFQLLKCRITKAINFIISSLHNS